MFKTYHKIHRLGAEENEGILLGKCYIQEKVDGANASIWLEEDGIHCGSRNNDVTEGSFNGFVEYAKVHEGITKYLQENLTHRLYGEWLVRHTIAYDELSYRQFYLFDIETETGMLEHDKVYEIADKYSIKTPQLFAVLDYPSQEQIKEFVGQSTLGNLGEGVVIKNHKFVSKFGEYSYAKVVTEKFKEDSAITFGGNNKHADAYWEIYCANKYVTPGRVEKIMNKIQPTVDKKLGMENTARIINTVYHDVITEEIWEIQKKVPSLNFKKLSGLCQKKAAQTYHELINK